MFEHVDDYAGDPILSLMESYQRDARAHKVNLSIGLYYDQRGEVPMLASVATALARLNAAAPAAPLYLPMEGMADYRSAVQSLLLGDDHPALRARRVATIQTLGGSGALKVGADFLRRYFPRAEVWVSDPTWENHIAIFEGAGFRVHRYPYFDPQTLGVCFDAMLATLEQLPSHSIVLLHPCCHNPTGSDLTPAQWDSLVSLLRRRALIPFLDIAYQGFGGGMEQDAYAIRTMAAAGLPCLVSNSFSKIFSLYGERVGGLSVMCSDEAEAGRVLGQLKATVRRNYSSPPLHGAALVAAVLNDAALQRQWREEVEAMRLRIIAMRERLASHLNLALPSRRFDYLCQQRGMFSYTGLSAQQVGDLRRRDGVYLVGSGRMCMAGLNEGNLDRVAAALVRVMASQE
ncbi:aromatic amino acid transaminase [Edwardsiella piscicida]|uniref:Aminotransferase n=3 Tax=Edwardsiella TaxID=635 RepID=A0A0H3DTY0_EDWTF|nr:amino acid aminotransferase [Edwardsiella piscicida]ACY86018.1 aromatic-amino-acid transaminase [Edwardsiella tarda EIB202]ADM42977.1 Biosynthetic Aromatic amino acid aminotransferase alpha [Edwardsiella tarda FL6-60]ARD18618.1 aromatic amino acid aminotransferase [Edwardsiella piscicida]ELM3659047.1 aspartate/tyrosine/aromatic aminotransferase [Edwardsiella piscicida]ELM3660060.1 aspartate/tyrosine/aromatic aminotransferase [Edwardsiella piscicida]